MLGGRITQAGLDCFTPSLGLKLQRGTLTLLDNTTGFSLLNTSCNNTSFH